MKMALQSGRRLLWCGLAWFCLGPLACLGASNSLHWDQQSRSIDAQIESWDLSTLLGQLSKSTGWRVYIEPGNQQTVSVRFKHLPVGEALKRMLGELNFALLPQTNAAPKLFIFRTSLEDATQLVAVDTRGSERKGAIPNEVVVTLRAGARQSIESLARQFGAKIIGRVDGLNTYRLQFPDEASAQAARQAFASNEDVAGTDANFPVERPTRAETLDLRSPSSFAVTPKLGNAGNQVVVAFIDTPVQPLDGKMNDFMLPAVHVAGDPTLSKDQLTHGTSMAETILHGLTYAPQENGGSSVRVLPVDVYGSNADTTTFDVAKGIYAALGAGATIINLSLGGAGDSAFLDSLIHTAHQQGVLFFAAAGNQPTTDPTFPAAYPDVVAVTAGDKKGNIAPYANRGDFVDVIAPGVSLVDYSGQSYLVRGTSAATAYVSGTAAGLRAMGSPAPNVETYLRQNLALRPAP